MSNNYIDNQGEKGKISGKSDKEGEMARKSMLVVLACAMLVSFATAGMAAAKLPLVVEGLYGGGAGIAQVGLSWPHQPTPGKVVFSLGYGLGSQYSIMAAQLKVKKPRENNLGWFFSLDYASYSESVGGIPGLSTVNKGAQVGLGVGLIKPIRGNTDLEIGYSTALGLTIGAAVKL